MFSKLKTMNFLRNTFFVLVTFFSLNIAAQTNFSVDTLGYYSGEVVDEVKHEKYMLYFFLRGEKEVYFLKSRSVLSDSELKRVQADLTSIENQGIYMFYEDGKFIVRTNNKEASKSENRSSEFHVLQGGFNAENELVLKYTSNKAELENLVFVHHK